MSKDKHQEILELQEQAHRLEQELQAELSEPWRPTGFYAAYYATAGFLLGIFGAMASLLANVIGATVAGKGPLELIRVYLTFPLGAKALTLGEGGNDVYAVPDGVVVAFGCCLYLATGMILGVPFHVAMMKFAPGASVGKRLGIASFLSLALWLIGFYGILTWLQPLLFGGNWITDPAVLPWWVAAMTHLVYGWTMALVAPLGQYTPYEPPAETP